MSVRASRNAVRSPAVWGASGPESPERFERHVQFGLAGHRYLASAQWGASDPIATELRRLSVPYIFMTGRSEETIDAAFAPAPVLRKPVAFGDIVRALRDCLESAHPR
jgi:hypothetical protein